MQTDTLIIGGGLSGLALAEMLYATGHDFLLVEARDRLGGRILTKTFGGANFDLGPAWFWPGQPRIAKLVNRYGLAQFEQFSEGILTYEDQNGVQRGQGYASMQGSYRLKHGFGALTSALSESLPSGKIIREAPVSHLLKRDGAITAKTPKSEITAKRVVLALPLRLAARIEFEPTLPNDTLTSMQEIPTWMAGHAKAVALYDRAFWRDAGLSGDAMSRVGPMIEVHDASPATGGPFALFGFIGMPPSTRCDETRLRQSLIAQLGRLFGPSAEQPTKLFVKDWAFEPFTSTKADLAPLYTHPQYGLSPAISNPWRGQLIIASTEVAHEFGGYLEGALEAAENAFDRLTANTALSSNA
ncbi:MAG: NAD(P)-binding protein [Silicimonas sp.]|nr:NAD(P)-binding protein [Silicimonas sp.]